MADPAARRLLSGQAWDDFCENLRRTGHMVERFDDADDLDRTEWYRCVSRYARGMLERYVEAAQPNRIQLVEMAWRHTINFTSPLQDQIFAEFPDGSSDYLITGNRGEVPYFVIASWTSAQPPDFGARNWAEAGTAGLKEFDPAMLPTTAFIGSQDVQFDKDGNFAIVVSQTKPEDGRDWLPMTADCVGLLIRTVYAERKGVARPTMHIERVNNGPPTPITPADLSRGLAKAAQATLGYAELIRSWWQDNLAKRPNTIVFSQAVYLSNGGVPDNRHHGFGSWACDADEALVVRFTPPPCDFWTFQIANMWQENLDNFEDGQGYLYKADTTLEPDGSVLFVLAHKDPEIGVRWIDCYGHGHGGWSSRLIRTVGAPPQIYVHRVKIEDLKKRGIASLTQDKAIVSGGLAD